MSFPDSGRASPQPAGIHAHVLTDQALSESPISTGQSTPAIVPADDVDEDSVSALRLDDIQSVVPYDYAPESGEVSATIAFPQDGGSSHDVPYLTITTYNHHTFPSALPRTTPSALTSILSESHATPPIPPNEPTSAPSTSSSALTERDKLTDLPASFSTPRLQTLARRVAEASAIPSQDSFSSSVVGQASRRSLESDHSSFAGTLPGRTRGDGTPKRVSFEGDRPSFSSSFQNVAKAFCPVSPDGRTNDPPPTLHSQKSQSSPARSPSPLRNFLWPLHRSHSRDEPFVPTDPYKLNPLQTSVYHVFSQVIRQIYRHALLRLPSIYFSRVSRVFEDAVVTRPEVQHMIEGRNKSGSYGWPADHEWVAPNVSPALIRFKESWETFVESVLKEWKTLNVVSALLMTCVVLLPIYGRDKPEIEGANTAPVIRTTAFLSLISALMSLVYGCIYILRFGTMKSMYKASLWAEEAQKELSLFWNVWVLLAMPAVWIAWSMIMFCICILDFVWDQPFSSVSGPRDFATSASLAVSLSDADRLALAPRIVISSVFVLGLVYFAMIVRTFRKWGDPRISEFVKESLEAGRWTPRTQSPIRGTASPRLGRESRFGSRNGVEIGDGEKPAMKQTRKERRTRSMDSAMV